MTIGVFDSGVGGKSVANALKKALPDHRVLFKRDSENLPYGTKTPEQLHKLVLPILQQMAGEGCEVIVVACNSVTTTIIHKLREEIHVPLVGIEPMVKPAAKLTKSRVIAVCATPVTLGSERYTWLKETYAEDIEVIEPECSNWAEMIEGNALEHEQLQKTIDAALSKGADVIVMGCTHYHWIADDVERIADGRAIVIQPEEAVVKQLKRVLAQLG